MFLTSLDVELKSALGSGKSATLDTAHQVWVNHEVFFVANEAERRRFRAEPLRWCGIVTDPVSRRRFRPTDASPMMRHADRPFYFTSDSTHAIFAATPDSFVVPVLRMVRS